MITGTNPWEYTTPQNNGALLYLTVAVTTKCNFNCSFCSKAKTKPVTLDPRLLREVLNDAVALGLTKVEFTGGEPLLYPELLDFAAELRQKDVTTLIVTNGSLITKTSAEKLASLKAMVAVSLSTLDSDHFDRLSGTKGNYPKVVEGIHHLKEAGFSSRGAPLLALQSLASKDTLDELPDLKAWAEANDCLFILNRPIPVGAMSRESVLSGAELRALLGPDSKVPFSLDSACNRLTVGCYIGSDAIVRPCPCIDLQAGSLKQEKLSEIWCNAKVLDECRKINDNLRGSCGECEEKSRCYGCRAVAYAVFKDIGAPDPGCYRYQNN